MFTLGRSPDFTNQIKEIKRDQHMTAGGCESESDSCVCVCMFAICDQMNHCQANVCESKNWINILEYVDEEVHIRSHCTVAAGFIIGITKCEKKKLYTKIKPLLTE